MDNQKIIDRLEKLRAMSEDTSSPHEAAIALGRMQRLMEKHGITTTELELNQIKEETSDRITRNQRAIPEYLANLAVIVGNAFECNPVVNTIWGGMTITYCGIHPGPLLAKYSVAVLTRQLTKARQDYIKSLPRYLSSRKKINAGNSFAMGWIMEAAKKANALNPRTSPEKQALIDQYVEQKISPKGEQQTTGTKNRYVDSMAAGAHAARDVQLNHGVDGKEQIKLGVMV